MKRMLGCLVYLVLVISAITAQSAEEPTIGHELIVEFHAAESGSISIQGDLLEYQWAHTSNRLALLVYNHAEIPFLAVFDVKTHQFTLKTAIPEGYRPRTLGWLPDDSGVIIAMSSSNPDEDEYFIDSFYQYRFSEGQFAPIYEHIEKLYSSTFAILFDRHSPYWAAASSGEGHPDVAVYKGEALIFSTDVYPSFISPLVWQNSQLYCVSGAWLEFGLTRDEREQHPDFTQAMYEGRDEGVVYAIDPLTQQAKQVSLDAEKLIISSFDQMYEVSVMRKQQTFTLTITPSHE